MIPAKIPTAGRCWPVKVGVLFIAASAAALMVLAYAPEFAAWWLQ